MRLRKGSASLIFIVVLVTVPMRVRACGAGFFPIFASRYPVGLWLFDESD